MRELFFPNEPWPLTGDGDFNGTFHLFKGGHDLAGRFTSDVAGVNDYRFPSTYGSLHWTRSGFEVTDAGVAVPPVATRSSASRSRRSARPIKPTGRFDASYTRRRSRRS